MYEKRRGHNLQKVAFVESRVGLLGGLTPLAKEEPMYCHLPTRYTYWPHYFGRKVVSTGIGEV